MNELECNVLKLLYDEKEQIIRKGGWSEGKIRRHIENCNKSALKLALQWLISKKYVEKTTIKSSIKGFDGKNINLSDDLFKISSKGIEFYVKEGENMEQLKTLEQVIDKDIAEINLMESKTPEQLVELYSIITTRYHNYIPNFSSNLYGYIANAEMYDTELSNTTIKADLIKIKAKLEMFKITGYQASKEVQKTNKQDIIITNNNTNSNSQDNKMNINISFEGVRNKIGNIDSISDEELKEIYEKINNIESIITENSSSTSKWSKISPILKWIADKSVDVGIAMLPLILKI